MDARAITRPAEPLPPPPAEPIPLPRPAPIVDSPPPAPEDLALAPEPLPLPLPAPAPPPAPSNAAVTNLLQSAEAQLEAGNLEQAAASLERALRIEPRNASIWYDLGQIRLAQTRYDQAESLATKSNSLAAGNPQLQARNWRLIAQARRGAGDLEGAATADAQAARYGP